MQVKNFCNVETNNYQKTDNWKYFYYLDTGSIHRNNIESLQYIEDEVDLPSRAKQKVSINDILYSSVRPNQNHYGFIDKRYDNLLVSTGFIILKPIVSKVIPKYLYYYLTQEKITNQLQAIAQNSTSSYPSIAKDDLLNLNIDIPLLEEQFIAVQILSSIDSQIERNNAMVKKLQVLGQAVFNRFFSSEDNLISLLEFPYIQILKPGIDKFDGEKHYIATAEVEGEKLNYNSPFIYYETRENRANMQPVENSVWFAKMKKSIKHIYVSTADSLIMSNYIFSTGFCGVKCENIVFEFMVNYLNLPYFEMKKDILSHGATMEGVNNDDLKSIQIPLPSKEKIIDFHTKTKDIYLQISRINKMNCHLFSLKEKLLPLLINGQLI